MTTVHSSRAQHQANLLPGIQVFQNTDKVCPERHGGTNNTKLYIDSSEPVPGGGGMWKNDTSIKFECYKKSMTPFQKCTCAKYKVYHTVYQNGTVPKAVEYLSGTFVKVEDEADTYGLLAPLYREVQKNLYLFSHHPEGLVWQVSQKLTTTPLRGVFPGPSCPDSNDIVWEWYNMTTTMGQQLYVKDNHIKVLPSPRPSPTPHPPPSLPNTMFQVKCVSHSLGA